MDADHAVRLCDFVLKQNALSLLYFGQINDYDNIGLYLAIYALFVDKWVAAGEHYGKKAIVRLDGT